MAYSYIKIQNRWFSQQPETKEHILCGFMSKLWEWAKLICGSKSQNDVYPDGVVTGREHEGDSRALVRLFVDLNTVHRWHKLLKVHQSTCSHYVNFFGKYTILVKRKPQVQNGVICAKAHDTKPRLNTWLNQKCHLSQPLWNFLGSAMWALSIPCPPPRGGKALCLLISMPFPPPVSPQRDGLS